MLTDSPERENNLPGTRKTVLRETVDVNDAACIMRVSNPTIWKRVPSGKLPKAVMIVDQPSRLFAEEVVEREANLSECGEQRTRNARMKADGLNRCSAEMKTPAHDRPG